MIHPVEYCIANKIKDINLNVFNIIKRINKSKTLTKHISCKYKCKFDGTKSNSNQKKEKTTNFDLRVEVQ